MPSPRARRASCRLPGGGRGALFAKQAVDRFVSFSTEEGPRHSPARSTWRPLRSPPAWWMCRSIILRAVEWIVAEAEAMFGFTEVHYDESGRRREPILRLLPWVADPPALLSGLPMSCL